MPDPICPRATEWKQQLTGFGTLAMLGTMFEKIVSGGQTGVDRTALDVALDVLFGSFLRAGTRRGFYCVPWAGHPIATVPRLP